MYDLRYLKKIYWSLPLSFQEKLLSVRRRDVLDDELVFIHIPKNGGSAVSKIIYGRNIGHLGARHVSNASALKFAFIRDPLERYISAFNFLSSRGTDFMPTRFQSHIVRHYEINQFSLTLPQNYKLDYALFPQFYWVDSSTMLIPYENITDVFTGIEKINESKKKKSLNSLESSTIEKLKRFYSNDFLLRQVAFDGIEEKIQVLRDRLQTTTKRIG